MKTFFNEDYSAKEYFNENFGMVININELAEKLKYLPEGAYLSIKGENDSKEYNMQVTFPYQLSIPNVYHIGIASVKKSVHPSTIFGSITLDFKNNTVMYQRTMNQQVQPVDFITIEGKKYILTESKKSNSPKIKEMKDDEEVTFYNLDDDVNEGFYLLNKGLTAIEWESDDPQILKAVEEASKIFGRLEKYLIDKYGWMEYDEYEFLLNYFDKKYK